jgi:hypothetical protein
MTGLDGVKVGDTLLLVQRYGGAREKQQVPQEVTVVKVGTKLLHIPLTERDPDGKTLTYRIEDGRRNDNYGHTELWTREAYEAEKSRESVEAALKAHGVEAWRNGPKPIAVLEALLDVLERAERGEIK